MGRRRRRTRRPAPPGRARGRRGSRRGRPWSAGRAGSQPRARFLQSGYILRRAMAAVATPGGSRRLKLRYLPERRGFLATLLIAPAVLFIAALVAAPLVLAVYLSLTDATSGSLGGRWVGLEHYRHLFDEPVFVDAIWHTFLFTAISQAVVVLCSGLIAHALVHKFRGRWLLRL